MLKICLGAGKMTQQLGTLAIFLKDESSVLSIHTNWLTIVYNSSFRDPSDLGVPLFLDRKTDREIEIDRDRYIDALSSNR